MSSLEGGYSLTGLAAGREELLSRSEPAFSQPGKDLLRPLADPHLSRRPLRFVPGGEPGGGVLDGTVQGMMDLMGLTYTHSGMVASVIAIDKELTKQALVPHGIPMPGGRIVRSEDLYAADPLARPEQRRILMMKILPNTLPPMMVQLSLNMGWAILNAAGLSFIGLGVKPPTPTWGGMIREGFEHILDSAWLSIAPSIAWSSRNLASSSRPWTRWARWPRGRRRGAAVSRHFYLAAQRRGRIRRRPCR